MAKLTLLFYLFGAACTLLGFLVAAILHAGREP